ncbi:hydrogenase nickel incorporation protein HypB [Desulforhopalus singaporensis]|uniref:Hydrogenase nickel incorporation protein HypB n=1 Tax=Desulforhopalus singaporensis TaxID=91360 RepID=A0A1H0TXD4_9BACT|nr:hydrogenase nickel incorporation protein HypB [Desulforhopalus singaporensis]SDP58594.1 Hydrogenase nickel incorporation protein HypB [Desulforhopalus singaporensis]
MTTELKIIKVKENILADNETLAGELRNRLRKNNICMINLMSSPGAGKTTFLLRTIEGLRDKARMAVIEADIDSTVDAETISRTGTKAVQLQTGGFCHLDAAMVEEGLKNLDLDNLDLIFIENVGNLVCPAEFDTGATLNVMILSVPEGDDKPLKYPLMFSTCDVLIVNKTDYLGTPFTDFDLAVLEKRVRNLNQDINIFALSSKTGEGIGNWISWLATNNL